MAERAEFLPLGADIQIIVGAPGSTVTPVSECQNFIPNINSVGVGGKKTIKFVKRNGYNNSIGVGATLYYVSQGLQWTGVTSTGTTPSTARGVVVFACDRPAVDMRLYKFDTNGSNVLLGTFATADYQCIGIQETLISNVANLVLNVRLTSSPWTQKILFFPNGGALTEVTDGDLPTGIIGCGVPMDGYYFFAAGGAIWNTDLNSLSAITATSFISAQMTPDSLVGLARTRNIIWALGTGSLEPFQNVGNASGSPLQRIANGALNIGVLHQLACQRIGEDLIFISVSTDGVGVHMLKGGAVQKVSTPFIDALLSRYSDIPENTPQRGGLIVGGAGETGRMMFSGICIMQGVQFAVLSVEFNRLYAYAPSLDIWVSVPRAASGVPCIFPVGAQQLTFNRYSNKSPMDYYSEGSSSNPGQDNGLQLNADIMTVPITHSTPNLKFSHKFRILGDVQSAATPIVVSYSDDNGATFTTWGTIDMSISPPAILTRGGSYRRRIYKLSNASDGGCAIDGAEETFSIGTS